MISALAAATLATSALGLFAAFKVGARSEETLVVPTSQDVPRRDR